MPVPPEISTAAPSMALVAGEASGDLLAGLLLEGLRRRWSDLHPVGIGGPRMVVQGFEAWWAHERLAVHGFSWELLRRYREILGIRNRLRERLLRQPVDVFVGVDAPDFNLGLEADLRAAGMKTVHFVCPSIWAWRPERVLKLRQSADHVLCLFPFEPALLHQHGIAATYVGHPLANVVPMQPDQLAARTALGLAPDAEVLAILPGSRSSEVQHLTPRFFAAAALIHQSKPAMRFVVPAVPSLEPRIAQLAKDSGIGSVLQVVRGNSHTVLAACDVTLIASGTATLEAALFKKPMVIAYHMAWLSWQIMRRKQLQPWVGLPNILCEDFVVPELLQEAATPQALAQAVLHWFDDKRSQHPRIAALHRRFTQMHHSLLRDTQSLASQAIADVLHRA